MNGKTQFRVSALLLSLLMLFSVPTFGGEASWNFDERGFLTGDNPGEEYILEDAENGVWEYASRDLSVRINRYREDVTYKRKKVIR